MGPPLAQSARALRHPLHIRKRRRDCGGLAHGSHCGFIQCFRQVPFPAPSHPSACICGCENLARVVVERVAGRPIVTELVACAECRCVYYAPLSRVTNSPDRAPLPEGFGKITNEPWLLKAWGGAAPVYRPREQSAEELQRIKDDPARANRSKRKR